MATTLRLLVIEDDDRRVLELRAWLRPDARLVHARSAGRAIGVLRRDRGDVYAGVMLDHDLHQQAATGSDLALSGTQLADVIARYVSQHVPILVHSTNRDQGTAMAQALAARGFAVEHIPRDELTEDAFVDWLDSL